MIDQTPTLLGFRKHKGSFLLAVFGSKPNTARFLCNNGALTDDPKASQTKTFGKIDPEAANAWLASKGLANQYVCSRERINY